MMTVKPNDVHQNDTTQARWKETYKRQTNPAAQQIARKIMTAAEQKATEAFEAIIGRKTAPATREG